MTVIVRTAPIVSYRATVPNLPMFSCLSSHLYPGSISRHSITHITSLSRATISNLYHTSIVATSRLDPSQLYRIYIASLSRLYRIYIAADRERRYECAPSLHTRECICWVRMWYGCDCGCGVILDISDEFG